MTNMDLQKLYPWQPAATRWKEMVSRIVRGCFFEKGDTLLEPEAVEEAIVQMTHCSGAVISADCPCREHVAPLDSEELVRTISNGSENASILFLSGNPPLYLLKATSMGVDVGSPVARFSMGISERARELLGRRALIGSDYAVAEVLSCGYYDSRPGYGQEAVDAALLNLINRSSARVIVSLGVCPAVALRRVFGISAPEPLFGPVIAGEYTRFLAFLPHSLASRSKSFDACLTIQEVSRLKSFLEVTKALHTA